MPQRSRPGTVTGAWRRPAPWCAALVVWVAATVADRPLVDAKDGSVQESTPLPAPGLIESITSEMVLIEAYVTDLSGHPVRGLTKDDFILEVDGLRRSIATSEYVEIRAPEGTPAG